MPAVATLEGTRQEEMREGVSGPNNNLISSGRDQVFYATGLNSQNRMHFPLLAFGVLFKCYEAEQFYTLTHMYFSFLKLPCWVPGPNADAHNFVLSLPFSLHLNKQHIQAPSSSCLELLCGSEERRSQWYESIPGIWTQWLLCSSRRDVLKMSWHSSISKQTAGCFLKPSEQSSTALWETTHSFFAFIIVGMIPIKNI